MSSLDSDNSRILELLEEILDTGIAPEDACRDDPQLLAEVLARLARVRKLEAEMDALLPSATSVGSASVGGDGFASPSRKVQLDRGLPVIPGYEVEGVIGYGGAGVVYKARHLRLNRTVAVKMLLAGAYAGPHELKRFRHEAEAIAGLRHPNIVQLYDAGECDGRPYFTMEYMEGGSLRSTLDGAPQSAERAARCLASLARAVQVAHASGIVHRDLKPGNILIAADGTPKIADFGLARRLERDPMQTITAAAVGTPSYMAPEQAAGRPEGLCTPVDVYALGAILYDMLTGRPPFRADTPAATQRQVIDDEPEHPSRINGKVPLDVETICLKCLQKDPRRRYETAAALADDLERFLRREPVEARRTGPVERAYKWTRRRPGRAAFLVAGLLGIGSVVGAGLWMGSQRAAINQAVGDDLTELAQREAAGKWKEARDLLERARTRLGDGGPEALHARLDAASADLDLVSRLESIRYNRADSGQQRFDRAGIGKQYAAAFADAGLLFPADDPHVASARIAASPIKVALVSALDDWILSGTTDLGVLQGLLKLARLADPDPTWRDLVRSTKAFTDPSLVQRLSREADVTREPVPLLLLVASLLHESNGGRGDGAVDFLARVRRAHPGDFFVNFLLGELYDERDDPESIPCYRGALAARPGAVAALTNLGLALHRHSRTDEAIECWKDALGLDPGSMMILSNLGLAYFEIRDFPRSEQLAREMISGHPDDSMGHSMLGQTLMCVGRFEEARRALRRAIELTPEDDARGTESMERFARRCDTLLALEDRLEELARDVDLVSTTQERVDAAELLAIRGRFAPAVAYYDRAFEADPVFAAEPPENLRSNAAGAALSASVEEGADAPAYRARALAWLRGDLERWRRRLDVNDGEARNRVRIAVRGWRYDPALAPVRGKAGLGALPESERSAWSALWFDVDAIIAKTQQR